MSIYVTDETINLVTQMAYKAKVIAKPSRRLFVQRLYFWNDLAVSTETETDPATLPQLAAKEFTAPARKFKRVAAFRAAQCFLSQMDVDHAEFTEAWEASEERRLLTLAMRSTARHAGYRGTWHDEPSLDDDGDQRYDEWGEPIETLYPEQHMSQQLAVDALAGADPLPWWDITAEQFDPESEDYANSVMVRPLDVIRAEQEAAAVVHAAEAERIRQTRMSAAAQTRAERGEDGAEDDLEDEDDWDLDDDQPEQEADAADRRPDEDDEDEFRETGAI